jgi:hypothetical protein
MKKLVVGLVTLLVLAGGWLAAAHLSGGAFYSFGVPVGGDRGELRRLSRSFLEDVQFKDFKRAASYHAPEKRDTVDIPFLIQRLFQLKPEVLDIQGYQIVFSEIDSTDNRGRVKSRVKYKELVRGQLKEQELILYWERAGRGAPWYMKLEDSLRNLEAEKGKKS